MSSRGKPSQAHDALKARRDAGRAARADAAARPASRVGGFLLALFGLPFLCGGLLTWSALVLVPMGIMRTVDKPETTLGWATFGVFLFLFGGVFVAIGGGIAWSGVMTALGKGALPSKRPGPDLDFMPAAMGKLGKGALPSKRPGGTRPLKAQDLTDWRADAAFRKAPGAGQPAGARAALRPAIGRWSRSRCSGTGCAASRSTISGVRRAGTRAPWWGLSSWASSCSSAC